jgi:hypothetical protein
MAARERAAVIAPAGHAHSPPHTGWCGAALVIAAAG